MQSQHSAGSRVFDTEQGVISTTDTQYLPLPLSKAALFSRFHRKSAWDCGCCRLLGGYNIRQARSR